MCTPKGGIECDVTVTKLAGDHYYVVSAAATELHDYDWIARHVPDDGSVLLENTHTTRSCADGSRAALSATWCRH